MAKTVSVVCASDDNYAPFMSVMMKSVMMHTDSRVVFFVLDGGISEASKAKITADLIVYDNVEVRYFDTRRFDLHRFPDVGHYSVNTFARYFIPQMEGVPRRVIYLDVDIIVNGDIVELYDQDLQGKAIGAVLEDFDSVNYGALKERVYPEYAGGDQYFNAGVLVLDVDALRAMNFTEKSIALTMKLHDKLHAPDQDVLNIMFEGNFAKLDYKFDFMPDYAEALKAKHPDYAFPSPVVVHYTFRKPWKARCKLDTLFDEVLKESRFFGEVKKRYWPVVSERKIALFRRIPFWSKCTVHSAAGELLEYKTRLLGVFPIRSCVKRGEGYLWRLFGLKVASDVTTVERSICR